MIDGANFESHFADQNQPTAAEVLDRVKRVDGLNQKQRREIASAWESAGRWFGIPLDKLIAHPQNLAPRFARLSPGALGVTKKRIANVKSLVVESIHLVCDQIGKSFKTPLTPEWAACLAKAPTLYDTASIRCMARYGSACAVSPDHVDEHFSAALLKALIEERLNKNPRIIHQNALRRWNVLVVTVDGWPQKKLQIPTYRKQTAEPWSSYPASLLAEIDEFFDKKTTSDPLDLDKPLTSWSAATIKYYRACLRRFLSQVVKCGTRHEDLRGVSDILKQDTILAAFEKAGLRTEAAGRAGGARTAKVLLQLAQFAELRPTESEENKSRFKAVSDMLRPLATRLHKTRKRSTKNRERLSPLKHERNLAGLFLLPFALERELKKVKTPDRRDALLMQWAVALMILVFCPLRIESLCSLRIDRHLRWSGDDMSGDLNLEFAEGELKNGQAATLPLPRECARIIRAYVRRFKHLLSTPDDPHLITGADPSRPKRPWVMSTQIKRLIFDRLGLDVNVHLFRHVVHLVVLKRFPGAYGMIARVLTHRGITTATKNYAEYDATLSVAAYADLVRAVQMGGGAETKCSLADRVYNAAMENHND